jgi:hypothetical protein
MAFAPRRAGKNKMDEHWQEIERVYHAARELDKSARPALG